MNGPGYGLKVVLLYGRLPPRNLLMLVSHAGVGVVSMKDAPLALPTFAIAQFKRFFDCGRAVGCMLPVASGRFLHLLVLYGYLGADTDAEHLALTEQ